MEDKRILELVNKFEKSIEDTARLTNILLGLEGVLDKFDKSIKEVYELTKIDSITEKSIELLESLKNLKEVQNSINKEYKEFASMNLYNNGFKEEIKELKSYIIKLDENVILMKEDIYNYKKTYEEENIKFKEELVSLLNIEYSKMNEIKKD